MIDALCKLLGIREDQAEDALRSERAAREALTRRSFFGVAGALAAGTAFSFAAPVDTAAAYDVRLLSYPILVCSKPGANLILDPKDFVFVNGWLKDGVDPQKERWV